MDITTVLHVLKSNSAFCEFSALQVQELLLFALPRSIARGQALYMRGEATNNTFCLILSGSVHIIDDDTGLVAVRKSGDIIGEIALFVPQHQRTFSVQSMEPVDLLEWDIQHIGNLLPVLKKHLFRLVWQRLPPGFTLE